MSIKRRTYLEFVGGTSAKGYEAFLTELPSGGFRVHATYGRIGSLSSVADKGTYTDVALAEAAFAKLVDSKTAKGYVIKTEDAEASPSFAVPVTRTKSTLELALLTPADDRQLERLLVDDRYWALPKYDGKRIAIDTRGSEPVAVNRNGVVTSAPKRILDAIAAWAPAGSVVDGELLGTSGDGHDYVVFDRLFWNGEDVREKPFSWRLGELWDAPDVRLAGYVETEKRKRELLEDMRELNGEGIVLRLSSGRYRAGRLPESSASDWKFKLWAEAEVVVIGTKTETGKDSFQAAVLADDSDKLVYVGNVTLHGKRAEVHKGDIVTIRYLYVGTGGHVYQPAFIRVRDDKTEPDRFGTLKLVNKKAAD